LNARDVARLQNFYAPMMSAFYRARNVSREFVLADKVDQFRRAEVLRVRADAADIALPPDGRSAALTFRKRYEISGGGLNRVGEVVSELRWARSPSGWVITSERDLTVPRKPGGGFAPLPDLPPDGRAGQAGARRRRGASGVFPDTSGARSGHVLADLRESPAG
jgi:hypothetical protein